MKICPACNTTYTDDTLRFCMKDGTPLVSSDAASTQTNEEEQTVVSSQNLREPKMVVPLRDESNPRETPGLTAAAVPQQKPLPARKSNSGALVTLGVLALLAIGGFGAWWLFAGRSGKSETAATNSRTNLNQNANVSVNQNLSSNINGNLNTNANENANLKTPTPTPNKTPTATPTRTPTPANRNANLSNANASNANSANANAASTPSPANTPASTPRPQPTTVSGGVINGKASTLPKPAYPPAARAVRASGQVQVQVLIDENGRVVSAQAVTGHPLLKGAAESAARQARFQPTMLSNQPVKVSGTIIYNFNISN